MLTKKELQLLTEVLNLEGVKVTSKHQHEGIGIILEIESSVKTSGEHPTFYLIQGDKPYVLVWGLRNLPKIAAK